MKGGQPFFLQPTILGGGPSLSAPPAPPSAHLLQRPGLLGADLAQRGRQLAQDRGRHGAPAGGRQRPRGRDEGRRVGQRGRQPPRRRGQRVRRPAGRGRCAREAHQTAAAVGARGAGRRAVGAAAGRLEAAACTRWRADGRQQRVVVPAHLPARRRPGQGGHGGGREGGQGEAGLGDQVGGGGAGDGDGGGELMAGGWGERSGGRNESERAAGRPWCVRGLSSLPSPPNRAGAAGPGHRCGRPLAQTTAGRPL